MKFDRKTVHKAVDSSIKRTDRDTRTKAKNPYAGIDRDNRSKAKNPYVSSKQAKNTKLTSASTSFPQVVSTDVSSMDSKSSREKDKQLHYDVRTNEVSPDSKESHPSLIEAKRTSRATTNSTTSSSKIIDRTQKLSDRLTAGLSKLTDLEKELDDETKVLDENLEKLAQFKRNDDEYRQLQGKSDKILSLRDIDDIWGKASAERSMYQERIVLYCSKALDVNGQYQVVFFPIMLDKKGEIYWCYKSDIFGFHHRCIDQMLAKLSDESYADLFNGYDEVFKRGQGDTIEVSSRMKTPNNDPEKVGNKVLFYIYNLNDNSDECLESLIEKFVKRLTDMHQHSEYLKLFLDKTFQKYGGKFTDVMKSSMVNDRTFARVLNSAQVHIEKNVSLYDVTNSDGVRYIMNQLFKNSKPPFMAWGYNLKTFCFPNGVAPKGFTYPN